MRFDVVAFTAIAYIISLVMECFRLYSKEKQKSRLTAKVSGLILFAYATMLYMTNQDLANHAILVIVSLTLLQLSVFDDYKVNKTRKPIVMGMVHAIFAWYFLR
ncbi:hypothetical protein KG089_02945 [Carnobacteriaceae bacterium zg-ZUI252]|nr:hypothetical protein [Carnobacteriaceae bacterium zg-ZUI252]MBS4769907.1 hypothetical protein [Carnobacteriaceae bacterium zg-ZUI240]